MEQLETTIQEMSASERKRFVHWFDAHRHELIPEMESAQQREVLSRLAETELNPAALESFEEADLDRMIREAAHARTQKAPAGRG
jgi:hypothetical protein